MSSDGEGGEDGREHAGQPFAAGAAGVAVVVAAAAAAAAAPAAVRNRSTHAQSSKIDSFLLPTLLQRERRTLRGEQRKLEASLFLRQPHSHTRRAHARGRTRARRIFLAVT